jgi:hypothetical protein
MHSRLNLPGRHEFSRGGRAVAATANDLMHLGDLPASAPGDVAIVYDYEAHWVTGIQPHGVARADQRAQNQRQEETHKARDLPNDVARAVALLLVRQAFVCVEAEQSGPQRHQEYEDRDEDDGHENALYELCPSWV